MANRCDICGKQTETGHNISHSNRKTKTKWYPNLIDMKAMIEGKVQKIRICTKCLKKGNVEKVL